MIGVYEWYNRTTCKSYIGSSIDLKQRESKHIRQLRANKHTNGHLQNAFNKYGESSFEFRVIQETTKAELREVEQFWIDFYNATNSDVGYNILKVAGTSTGYKHTETSLVKMCAFQKTKGVSTQMLDAAIQAKRKEYVVTFPDGSEQLIKGLRAFCREHGLQHENMSKVARGLYTNHKGYKCRYNF